MENLEWAADAHCHWSDSRLYGTTALAIPQMIEARIRIFQLGGVDPADWARQTALAKQFPNLFWRSFGLHPYYVEQASDAELESAFAHLRAALPEAEALGELGLDFRRSFQKRDRQILYFERQLALAAETHKPLVLHVVHAHEDVLKRIASGAGKGMVHAFTGNVKLAQRYWERGFLISLGAKLLDSRNADLSDVAAQMPLESLLIESDCPDQAPFPKTQHDSTTVWQILARLAEIRKRSLTEVTRATRHNLFSLMNKELPQ